MFGDNHVQSSSSSGSVDETGSSSGSSDQRRSSDAETPLLLHNEEKVYTPPTCSIECNIGKLDYSADSNESKIGRTIIIKEDDDIQVDLEPLVTPKAPHRTLRCAFFTMFPIFMGYSSLVTMQAKIKHRMHIGDDSSHASYEFSFATSLLYLGNLIFRLMHNIIFAPLSPRRRVMVSYVCLVLATSMLAFAYYIFETQNMCWVYIAYILGGVGIGTFESNLMSNLTPLGHGTKAWAQYGIPIGFNGVSVGAFLLFAAFPTNHMLECGVYLAIAAANLLGLVFYVTSIPDIEFESTNQGLRLFFSDIVHAKKWVYLMAPYCLALMVDMFGLSFFSAIQLFIYDTSNVPFWPGSVHTLPANLFRAMFNMCSLIGDTAGRKLAYHTPRHIHPFWFLLFTVSGGAIILSKAAIIAPIGMLFVMFANGSIYAHTTKYVDDGVAHRFNLIALSFWLFIGDVGSFTGANVVNPVRVLIGADTS